MAAVKSIDSNVTGLRYAEEESLGVLPGSGVVWHPLEPNSYREFGGQIAKVARDPINASRQNKKGVTTDLDASGGFQTDLTQTNLQDIFQGFFFADLRTKTELAVATVDGTNNDYEPASGGGGYVAGDLLFAKGFDNDANNGLKVVSGTPGAATVPVSDTALVDETTASGIISRVGFQFDSADAEIDVTGGVVSLITAVKDLTELGLIPGEWVFVGGDATGEKFATAANNGFARIRSISENAIVFDKTSATMVADAGTGKTIRLFFGRVLKNEASRSLQVRRSYNLERTLGAPDDGSTDEQGEYLVGAVANQAEFSIKQADKITVDLGFVATDHVQVDAGALKSGDRPALVESDAFNTSSDITRVKIARITADEAVTPLFAFFTEMTLSISNNASPVKAVGSIGAFDVSTGNFEVTGSITGYFADVDAVSAVRDNDDVTLDMHWAAHNKGITLDIPLISLGNGRLNVEKDKKITLPLELMAATGAKIHPDLDHTLLMVFWDYLPSSAE